MIVDSYGAAAWSVVVLASGRPGGDTAAGSEWGRGSGTGHGPGKPSGPPATDVVTQVTDILLDSVKGWFQRRKGEGAAAMSCPRTRSASREWLASLRLPVAIRPAT